MMKSPMRLAPLAALLLLAPHARAATACKETPRARPLIVVALGDFLTTVDHSKGISEINKLHPVKKPKGRLSQGLTVVEHRLHYSADLEGACDKGCPTACAWVGAFAVDLTPSVARTFIPKEYKEDSCQYAELFEHERGHDYAHRRGLEAMASEMRAALARAEATAGVMGPIEADDRKAAFELLTERMEKVLRPIYEKHLALIRTENEGLDNLLEYKRLGKACRGKGWIRK